VVAWPQETDRRRRVQAQLDEIDAAVADVDERLALISRLAGEDRSRASASIDPASADTDAADQAMRSLLRGSAVRITAVQVLLAHPQRPERCTTASGSRCWRTRGIGWRARTEWPCF
jgi:hypothetical protein